MPDRVSHENPSVTTYRARLERSGGTRRPCLRLPDELDAEDGDIVRLVLDGDEHHAKIDSDARGMLIRGAYDNRRLARTPGEGENRLVEWAETNGRTPGTSVELDEVEPGHLYGLRVPGKRAVYSVTRQPKSSLADIAQQLDE
ncbi:DUF7112 family protein [Haloprofundus halophilus]|uniref:DUF7112 family protein n=1 Tax=Haloprofundus halophilus TaxID=2283527 RepID=UPI000E453253|nr:hypothetical protein [Haloprofundus halophilus]